LYTATGRSSCPAVMCAAAPRVSLHGRPADLTTIAKYAAFAVANADHAASRNRRSKCPARAAYFAKLNS
jgi:hypothetical protein